MDFMYKLMATEPVLMVFGLLGSAAGAAIWRLVPDNVQPTAYKLLAAIVAVGAPAIRSATISPATHVASTVQAVESTIKAVTPATVGGLGELTTGAVNVAVPIVTGTVQGVGGIAGGVLGGLGQIVKGTGSGLGSLLGGLASGLGGRKK